MRTASVLLFFHKFSQCIAKTLKCRVCFFPSKSHSLYCGGLREGARGQGISSKVRLKGPPKLQITRWQQHTVKDETFCGATWERGKCLEQIHIPLAGHFPLVWKRHAYLPSAGPAIYGRKRYPYPQFLGHTCVIQVIPSAPPGIWTFLLGPLRLRILIRMSHFACWLALRRTQK